MADDIDEEVRDLDIPADAAALVLYANGAAAMHLPKGSADSDDVPEHVLAIATFGALVAKHPEEVDRLVGRFMSGELTTPERAN